MSRQVVVCPVGLAVENVAARDPVPVRGAHVERNARRPQGDRIAEGSEEGSMFKIAAVSTAHVHTRGYLENLTREHDDRALCAVFDDVAERGRAFADEFGAPFVDDLAALTSDAAVDGFVVCAENTRHRPLLEALIPAGKPIFCEKPLTTTVADARRVADLLEQHGTKLMCGYFQPFSGVMQAAAKLLADGAFGEVTRVGFRNAHHAAYGRWFDRPEVAWFHDPALSGGGAMMDMGTHAVHLLRTLFGPVDAVWSVQANQAGIYPAVDDYGLAHLRFSSGMFGTVEAAWTQTGGIRGLEIVGSAKTLWNTGSGYVMGGPGEDPVPVEPLAGRPSRVDRLIGALNGEVTDDELQADLAAAVDAVAIMQAAYESNGAWTDVSRPSA